MLGPTIANYNVSNRSNTKNISWPTAMLLDTDR